LKGGPNCQPAGLQIQFRPLQAQNLPLAHSDRDGAGVGCFKTAGPCGFQEGAGLLRIERLDFLSRYPWRIYESGYIARDLAILHGNGESGAERNQQVLHRAWVEFRFKLRV